MKTDTDKLKRIEELVCKDYNCTVKQLRSSDRYRRLVEARAVISLVARETTMLTTTAIGRSLNRNHATVLHYNKLHDFVSSDVQRITAAIVRESSDQSDPSDMITLHEQCIAVLEGIQYFTRKIEYRIEALNGLSASFPNLVVRYKHDIDIYNRCIVRLRDRHRRLLDRVW